MRTIGVHTRVAAFVGAVALLIQIAPALATDRRPQSARRRHLHEMGGDRTSSARAAAPVFGLFEGFSGDLPVGSFVAEVLWRQPSLNGHVTGLEALYEVVNGDRSFSALIRGGQNAEAGGPPRRRDPGRVAHRRASSGRVSEVSRESQMPSCEGAPVNKNCFVGTIRVERAPKD